MENYIKSITIIVKFLILIILTPTAVSADSNPTLLSASEVKLVGEASGDEAGRALAPAGDVNGDGIQDVLVGAWGAGESFTGAAYLLHGPLATNSDLSASTATFHGESPFSYAGHAVASAGDVNNDGFDDILIGAWGDSETGRNAGAAYLIYGPVTGNINLADADVKLTGVAARDQAGATVMGAGDVNNDGFDDILIGAAHASHSDKQAGAAYLLYGPITAGTISLTTADVTFTGEAALDLAGSALAGNGDVNNDGFADILITATGHDAGGNSAGAAYLFYGPVAAGEASLSQADAKIVGVAAQDMAGTAVSLSGDSNNDGFADILIGAPHANRNGAAYLLLGPVNGTINLADADATFTGEAIGDQAGQAVAFAGDTNEDGRSDILIGASGQSENGRGAGAVYLIYGRDSLASQSLANADKEFVGAAAGDVAGFAIAGTGDVSGDGVDDFLVGAWGQDDNGDSAGIVYLVADEFVPTNVGLATGFGFGGETAVVWLLVLLSLIAIISFMIYRRSINLRVN